MTRIGLDGLMFSLSSFIAMPEPILPLRLLSSVTFEASLDGLIFSLKLLLSDKADIEVSPDFDIPESFSLGPQPRFPRKDLMLS